jgi:hypothetical protein
VEAGRIQLHVTKDDHLQVRPQHVGQEGLIHPRAANRSTRIRDDGVKDLEAPPSGHATFRRFDLAQHGGFVAWTQEAIGCIGLRSS